MTRIFTDGAEMGDAQFWDYNNLVSPIVAVSSPAPIGGTYCYRVNWFGGYKVISSAVSDFYLRYRFRASNTLYTGMVSLGWRKGTTQLGYVSIDAIGRFNAIVGTTEVAVSDVVMQQDTWYLIEVHCSIDGVAGRFEVFVDGTQEIDYTGSTQPGADGDVDNFNTSCSAYIYCYLDDLAMNDTAGISDNSWCGDGIITKMIPNGDGAHNNWTNSAGNSVNNWSYVDEYPNDGDATYVSADGSSSGTQDQYTLSDLDYTNKTVLRIYPEARARKTAADGSTLKLGILPSGGVDTVCAARTLYTDYYARIVGDEYTVNPVDSAAWEEADLDALQIIEQIG